LGITGEPVAAVLRLAVSSIGEIAAPELLDGGALFFLRVPCGRVEVLGDPWIVPL
jgi:hypothetical protein